MNFICNTNIKTYKKNTQVFKNQILKIQKKLSLKNNSFLCNDFDFDCTAQWMRNANNSSHIVTIVVNKLSFSS